MKRGSQGTKPGIMHIFTKYKAFYHGFLNGFKHPNESHWCGQQRESITVKKVLLRLAASVLPSHETRESQFHTWNQYVWLKIISRGQFQNVRS